MKQVVFAVLLIAMASLTGCLNGDEDSSDTTYKPSKNSTIILPYVEFEKKTNTVVSNCKHYEHWQNYNIEIKDSNSNIIWVLDGDRVRNISWGEWSQWDARYGWEKCDEEHYFEVNIILPQEPVRITVTYFNSDDYHLRTYAGTF
tara:strand:- start:279 stop:713 length:435 start_codon:yes stop_codon:yes gene_type:complete